MGEALENRLMVLSPISIGVGQQHYNNGNNNFERTSYTPADYTPAEIAKLIRYSGYKPRPQYHRRIGKNRF